MKPQVRTTLEEDFKELGLPISMKASARMAGITEGCGSDDDEKDEQDGEEDPEDEKKTESKKSRRAKKTEQDDEPEKDKEDDEKTESRKSRKARKTEQDGEDGEEDPEDEKTESRKGRRAKKSEQDDEEDDTCEQGCGDGEDDDEKTESRKARKTKKSEQDGEDEYSDDDEDDDVDLDAWGLASEAKRKKKTESKHPKRSRKTEQDGEDDPEKEKEEQDGEDEKDDEKTESRKGRRTKKTEQDGYEVGTDDEEDSYDDEGEYEYESKKRSGRKTRKEDNDPIDGVFVTEELLDRIDRLPFESMVKEDFDELLGELKKKKLPEGDSKIRAHAEKTVKKIGEAMGAARRMRRFKAGSTARETVFKCPMGKRAMGEGPGRKPCVPSHVAAGGVGKLKREGRLKRLWGRMAGGAKSARKSARTDVRRRPLRGEGLMSPFAQELMQVTESIRNSSTPSVRDEIVERIVVIFNLLNEEFVDKSVFEIYEETANKLIDSFEVGRLDEDSLDDNEFIAELQPALKLITKSLARLEDASGN